VTTTHPDRIDASTVRDWLGRPDPVTVLDVRSPAEFETVRIPGSVNVPLDLIAHRAGDLAPGGVGTGLVLSALTDTCTMPALAHGVRSSQSLPLHADGGVIGTPTAE
jgi:rhodanese-related sulfurtransferase